MIELTVRSGARTELIDITAEGVFFVELDGPRSRRVWVETL